MAVVSSFSAPMINSGEIILFDYNLEGRISRMKAAARYFNGNGTTPSETDLEYFVPDFEPVFTAPAPIYFDNLNEANMDSSAKKIYHGSKVSSHLPCFLYGVEMYK